VNGIRLFALTVAKNVKFHSSQLKAGQYSAEAATTRSKQHKTNFQPPIVFVAAKLKKRREVKHVDLSNERRGEAQFRSY